MIYRLLCVIILLLTAASCSGESLSGSKYKTTKIDTTNLFFTGEYLSSDGDVHFKDCATSKVLNFQSPKINKINELYLKMQKNNPIFCSFRGSYNSANSMVTATNFIGFNITETCPPITLNRVYAAQGDTLTLYEDYKYIFKIKDSQELRGDWGRMYKYTGMLLLNGGNGIEFTINEGNRYDNNNLFLSLKGVDGKGVVFLPNKN